MKSIKITVFAASLILGTSQLNASNQQQFSGVVTDSMCGASHMAKDKTPAECTRMCVKDGMKFALLVGDKVYTLNGHESELDKLAGEKVTVKGTANGDTVSVNSVSASK